MNKTLRRAAHNYLLAKYSAFIGAYCCHSSGSRSSAAVGAPAALSEDRPLRPEQAAWYLNVKTSWVYEAVRSGRLPCRRVGRHIRFTRQMLDEWLAQFVRGR